MGESYRVKYKQVVFEKKPCHDVLDGEFEFELPAGDSKRALAASKVLKILMKYSKQLVKVEEYETG